MNDKNVNDKNLHAVEKRVTPDARRRSNGHRGGILWMTGLSGAGKSTIGVEVERRLFERGYQAVLLDGDNVRLGLNADLGFSPKDRAENIRRVGEVASLFADAGLIVLTAFISPYAADRDRVRIMRPTLFHEVYVKAELAVCEARDPKGLYKKARDGKIAEFTGISAPYEAPEAPQLTIETGGRAVEDGIGAVLEYVKTVLALPERLVSVA